MLVIIGEIWFYFPIDILDITEAFQIKEIIIMEQQRRKQILDNFQEYLCNSYETYCQKHDEDIDIEGFVNFLIDRELIPNTNINRFTIQKEFERLFPTQGYHKTNTVELISDKYNISQRTVWNILKKT